MAQFPQDYAVNKNLLYPSHTMDIEKQIITFITKLNRKNSYVKYDQMTNNLNQFSLSP